MLAMYDSKDILPISLGTVYTYTHIWVSNTKGCQMMSHVCVYADTVSLLAEQGPSGLNKAIHTLCVVITGLSISLVSNTNNSGKEFATGTSVRLGVLSKPLFVVECAFSRI